MSNNLKPASDAQIFLLWNAIPAHALRNPSHERTRSLLYRSSSGGVELSSVQSVMGKLQTRRHVGVSVSDPGGVSLIDITFSGTEVPEVYRYTPYQSCDSALDILGETAAILHRKYPIVTEALETCVQVVQSPNCVPDDQERCMINLGRFVESHATRVTREWCNTATTVPTGTEIETSQSITYTLAPTPSEYPTASYSTFWAQCGPQGYPISLAIEQAGTAMTCSSTVSPASDGGGIQQLNFIPKEHAVAAITALPKDYSLL